MLDTARSIPTPEGIEITLTLAGPVPRALAWALDFVFRLFALAVASMLFGPTGAFGSALFFLLAFFLEWLYPAVCEVYWRGATPGKRLLKLRVLHDDGTPVTWTAALIRNLLRAVDFLPLAYGFGLASMLVSRDFKRLGDFAAGTVVVHDEHARRSAAIPRAAPLAPTVPLSLAEQRAVLDFAERSTALTEARAEELAELATPLVGRARGSDARARLLQIANYLLGRK